MASEDFDQVAPGFLVVHRLRQLKNGDQPFRMKVPTLTHQLHARGERFEVETLCAPKRVRLEEWNDDGAQIAELSHVEPEQIFAVIVVSAIPIHVADSKEFTKVVQNPCATRALSYCKPRVDLPAEPVASTVHSTRLSCQADGEATLAVYKADYPVA